jgi:hypothetical protein
VPDIGLRVTKLRLRKKDKGQRVRKYLFQNFNPLCSFPGIWFSLITKSSIF